MFACPCCNCLTFEALPNGSFEICPVCGWEDDNVQNDDPDYEGGANGISLNQARKNFLKFGAKTNEYTKHVRNPFEEEINPVARWGEE